MSNPPTDRPPRNHKREAMIGGTILAGIFGIAIAVTFSGDAEPERTPELDRTSAEIACEDYVADRLKAPATAEFSDAIVTPSGNRFTVAGTVDAENSFGALIRNEYTCTIDLAGDMWTLVSLDGLDG